MSHPIQTIYNTISTITTVCPSVRSFGVRCSVFVRHKFFFHLNRLGLTLTPGVDPRGWPRVAPGHKALPEELARARRALSSNPLFGLWSSRAWQHVYLPPRPIEKGHFRGEKGLGCRFHVASLYIKSTSQENNTTTKCFIEGCTILALPKRT